MSVPTDVKGKIKEEVEPIKKESQLRSNSIVTIASLNPYMHNWTIRARVVSKSPIRSWTNAKGAGSLFNMDLKDHTGEIRATGFKEECNKFHSLIEESKVYEIQDCSIKLANKRYNNLSHEYELILARDTKINVADETGVPLIEYKFRSIESISDLPSDTLVDIIGVCKYFNDCTSFISNSSGREVMKREIELVDQSNTSITLTLWGEKAEQFIGNGNPVVAVKLAKITEFQHYKGISATMSSSISINPNIEEAKTLRKWYDNEGSTNNFKCVINHSYYKNINNTSNKMLKCKECGSYNIEEVCEADKSERIQKEKADDTDPPNIDDENIKDGADLKRKAESANLHIYNSDAGKADGVVSSTNSKRKRHDVETTIN